MILLETNEGNKRMVVNTLKKISGFHHTIGDVFLEQNQQDIKFDVSKDIIIAKIRLKLQISTAFSLWFLERLSYFNDNLLVHVLAKEKEKFEES